MPTGKWSITFSDGKSGSGMRVIFYSIVSEDRLVEIRGRVDRLMLRIVEEKPTDIILHHPADGGGGGISIHVYYHCIHSIALSIVLCDARKTYDRWKILASSLSVERSWMPAGVISAIQRFPVTSQGFGS